MLHVLPTALLAAAFFGAGLYNAVGTPALRDSFVRWGYPAWWGRLTGALEMACAALIAFPATRVPGLILGAAIIVAAVATVLRHREFSHLAPLGVFAALMALAVVAA